VVWDYDIDDNAKMTYAFPSDITLLSGQNNYAEAFYVGDTGGRMWRFDISGTDTNLWGGEIIFDANEGTGSDVGRKFFYRPAAALIGGKVHLWFGSGDRAHPLNFAVVDRLYHLIDRGQDDDTVAGYIDEARLVDLTTDPLQAGDIATVSATLKKLYNHLSLDGVDPNYPYHGWFIKMNYDFAPDALTTDSTVVGEKVLAAPVMFNNEAYYTTYTPKVDPSANNPCAVGNLGDSRLYHLGASSGEAVFNYDIGNDDTDLSANPDSRAKGDGDTVLLRSDRSRSLGEGIPSGIVTLIDASGRVTMMVSASNRVETYNAPDIRLISPVYWMQW
jgi:type IV pilus assembly protein PilY1